MDLWSLVFPAVSHIRFVCVSHVNYYVVHSVIEQGLIFVPSSPVLLRQEVTYVENN